MPDYVEEVTVVPEETTAVPEESTAVPEETMEVPSLDQAGSTEYQQLVIQRLDALVTASEHQYALGLFQTACFSVVLVLVLLYKFLLRCFY